MDSIKSVRNGTNVKDDPRPKRRRPKILREREGAWKWSI
jgi:hypothetical protein